MDRPPLAGLLPSEMKELRWRPLFTFFLEVKKPNNLGKTPTADRRIAELTGGYFEGDRLKGKILTSGSDWQAVRDDGATTINVRTLLETDDGALIGMTYQGLRHGPKDILEAIGRGEAVNPNSYYMRVVPVFETSSEKYGWLNRIVAVAHGHRLSNGAIYNVFEVV
ncbi:MAG TPA: DUF3237 domain-containing protein [Pseudolabrys sp.]|nr:DUF3237 domain-containing protein [Pseudolabrys sp.]HVY19775.1 DUF3237 domain-containing protein [Bauldia sp.]